MISGAINPFKKIKICYVVSVDITLKITLLNCLKSLKQDGYEVSAVCSPGKWVEDIRKEGIKIKTIKITRKIFTPISDLIALVKLFLYFKKEKPDIVHAQTPKAGFLGRIAARLAGVPIVIYTNLGFYFHENSSLIQRAFFIFMEKIAAKFSDLIFSINKEDIETAIKEKICNPELIVYSGDGINIGRFNPSKFSPEQIIQKRKSFGLDAQNKVVGIVARLVIEKGYLDLFHAFKILSESFSEARLMVIGIEEPEKKDFFDLEFFAKKYGLEKKILFLGERTDVDELYSLMDVFVLPSHREGLGRVVLEASLLEKPVVATNIRGCRESVNDSQTGILVPVKNSKKLAEALIYLFNNPEEAKKMGKAGRIKAMKEFDEQLVFDRIKKEYKRLIKEKLKI